MASVGSVNGKASILIVAAAFVGLCVSIYGYLAPLTGITHSFGALLVCIASAALILDGAVLSFVRRREARAVWLALGFLGASCTLAAAYFLHAWFLAGATAVAVLGLIIYAASPVRDPSAEFDA
jgi:hypothetical protein